MQETQVSPPIFILTVASRSCSLSTRDHHLFVKIGANKSLWSSYNHPIIGLAFIIGNVYRQLGTYSGHVDQRRALAWCYAIDLCAGQCWRYLCYATLGSCLSSQLDLWNGETCKQCPSCQCHIRHHGVWNFIGCRMLHERLRQHMFQLHDVLS